MGSNPNQDGLQCYWTEHPYTEHVLLACPCWRGSKHLTSPNLHSSLNSTSALGAPGPSKVYVIVEGQAGQALPAGFVAKPSFRLSMRKGVHIMFMLGAAALQQAQGQQPQQQAGGDAVPVAPASAGQEAQHCSMGGLAVPGAVWLQSRWVLRGLKSSPDTVGMGH